MGTTDHRADGGTRRRGPRRRARAVAGSLLLALSCRALPTGGPSGDPAADLRSRDARVRADGAFGAWLGERRDLVPALVEALADPAPSVRAWAFRALRELTGERHGYHPFLPPEARAAAIARWRAWLRDGGRPASEAGGARDGRAGVQGEAGGGDDSPRR